MLLYKYINMYILSFLNAFVVLCYLPKLKRGMELVFSAGFLYTFSIKTFLTKYIPYQLTKFQYQIWYSYKDEKQNVLLNSYLAN